MGEPVSALKATQAPATVSPDARFHTVEPHESLSSIAKRYGFASYHPLVDANPSLRANPNYLQVGWRIVIPALPSTRFDKVVQGESVEGFAQRHRTDAVEVREENRFGLRPRGEVRPGQVMQLPPAAAAGVSAATPKAEPVRPSRAPAPARIGLEDLDVGRAFVEAFSEDPILAQLLRSLAGVPVNGAFDDAALERLRAVAAQAGVPLTPATLLSIKQEHRVRTPGLDGRMARVLLGRLMTPTVELAPGATHQERFIATIQGAARLSMFETGVPASITMAQCILESGWGRAAIGPARNYFGMKGIGPAGSVTIATREVGPGGEHFVNARFRAYHSMYESFIDHAQLLSGDQRYAGAMKARSDRTRFAHELQRAGYASDPNYARQLLAIVRDFGLARFDA